MHQIFLMIGLGERAGSGIPKIYSDWNWHHWRKPALYEKEEPAQTLLELRMLELMPEGVLEQLQEQLGDLFNTLPQLERLILATAATEQVVSNKRITEICTEHTHDITLALRALVKKGLLDSSGQGRGAIYSLSGQELPAPEQVFVGSGYPNLLSSSEDLDQFGRLLTSKLSAPVVHNLDELSNDFLVRLESIAQEPRSKKKLNKLRMRAVLIELCKNQFVTRQCLAELVSRDPDSLRQQYLAELVEEKVLRLAFPQSPTDSRQAYIAVVVASPPDHSKVES